MKLDLDKFDLVIHNVEQNFSLFSYTFFKNYTLTHINFYELIKYNK